jgi:hypothetical protein
MVNFTFSGGGGGGGDRSRNIGSRFSSFTVGFLAPQCCGIF